MFAKFAAFALCAAAFTGSAQAAVVLAQDNLLTIVQPGFQLVQGIGRATDRRQAQGVVAGKTGTLDHIDLQVGTIGNVGANNLAIEILHGGVGSLPAGPGASPFIISGSSLFAFNNLDQNHFLTLDVSSLNFNVTAGDQFLIYVYAQTPSATARFGLIYGEEIGVDADGNSIVGSNRNYAPAANYITDNTGNLPWQETIYDRGFRTYVNVAGVPEPASWMLMIAGFGMVGAAMRRQRGRVSAAGRPLSA
jgi:PEP-CTERM motif